MPEAALSCWNASNIVTLNEAIPSWALAAARMPFNARPTSRSFPWLGLTPMRLGGKGTKEPDAGRLLLARLPFYQKN